MSDKLKSLSEIDFTPAGKSMVNLVRQGSAATVQATGGRHAVKVDLGPHEAAVLKLSVQD